MNTGNNLIIWEKTPDKGILAYHIYRQTNIIGDYELIGTSTADKLSIFMDEEADPETRQWVYKITAVDTCTNESDIKVTSYHRPLFLQYTGAQDGVNLEWESYVVEGKEMEFVTYEILRGSDSSALSPIAEISADLRVYKDKDSKAIQYKYFYRVAGVKANPCYPSATLKADDTPWSHSVSNMEDNRMQETEDTTGTGLAGSYYGTLNIYPNPFSQSTSIEFPNPGNRQYKLLGLDLTGKLMYMDESIHGEKIVLERRNLSSGYYIIELRGDKLYRGTMVIE